MGIPLFAEVVLRAADVAACDSDVLGRSDKGDCVTVRLTPRERFCRVVDKSPGPITRSSVGVCLATATTCVAGADPAGSRLRGDAVRLRGCCWFAWPTVGSDVLRLLAPAMEVSCGLLNSNSMDAVDGTVERDVGLDRV